MSLISVYGTGRISVEAGSTNVIGLSTAWLGAAIREGDILWARGLSVRILRSDGGNALTLAHPWPGPRLTDEPYEIRYSTDSERVIGAAQNVLQAIRSGSVSSLTSLEPAENTIGYYTGYNSAALTTITELGRNIIGSGDINALQDIIGLLSQDSPLDANPDAVMKSGAFGLGSIASPQLMDLNAFDTPSGFYKVDARTTAGTKPPNANTADGVLILHPMPSQTMQVYLGMTELGRNFIRKSNSDGTWAPWRSIMLDFEFGSGPGSGLDADTLDGYEASDFMLAGDIGGGGILGAILEVDGAGSGLDADLFHGQPPNYYRSADNLNSGFIAAARVNPATTYTVGALISKNSIGIDTANTAGRALITYNQASNTLAFNFLNLPGNTLSPIKLSAAGIPTEANHLTTKAYVDAAVSSVLDASPEAIASLNDFLETLENDPNFANNIPNMIATKLDITAYTAADVLAKIKTVDGINSGLDAELFVGQNAAFYRNANNLNAGTILDARLPSSMTGKSFTGTSSMVVLTVSDRIEANAADTALSPSFTFAGDTNTGMYRPGSDLLGFSTGGVERMRLSSAGISGVGTLLTALNADNLASGTVPYARLPADLVRGTRTISTGINSGLTGGGSLDGNIALAVDSTVVRTTLVFIGGDGISDIGNLSQGRTISVDGTVLRTTGNQTKAGSLTITGELQLMSASSVFRFRKEDGSTKAYLHKTDTSNGLTMRVYSADGTQSNDFTFWGNSGILTSTAFQGDGSRLVALNASNLATGTVPNARMNGDYSFGGLTLSGKFLKGSSNSWDDGFEIRGNVPSIFFNQANDPMSAMIGISGQNFYVLNDKNSDATYEEIALQVNLADDGVRYFGKLLAYQGTAVTAGPGLTGGGNLTQTREVRLGDPGSITADSQNSVGVSSHTHFISATTIGELYSRMGAQAIGSVCFLARVNRSGTTAPGTLVPGSQLRFASIVSAGSFITFSFGGTPVGTWMALGNSIVENSNNHGVMNYKRVE